MAAELFPFSSITSPPLPDSDAVSPPPHTESSTPAATGEIVAELSSSAGPTASASLTKQQDATEKDITERFFDHLKQHGAIAQDPTVKFLDRMFLVTCSMRSPVSPIPGETEPQRQARELFVQRFAHYLNIYRDLDQSTKDILAVSVQKWAVRLGIP